MADKAWVVEWRIGVAEYGAIRKAENAFVMTRRKKLYIYDEFDELCIDMDSVKERMADDGIAEKTVSEAIVDHDTSYFWCLESQDVCMSGEGTCGKDCKEYEPRNKRFGVCKWLRRCRMPGEDVIVKI